MMKSVDKMTKKEKKAYYAKFRNKWEISPVMRKENKNKHKEKFYCEKMKYD